MPYRVIKQFADNPTLCASIGGVTVALNEAFEDVRPESASGPQKKRTIQKATQEQLKYLFDNGTNIIEQYEEKKAEKPADKTSEKE